MKEITKDLFDVLFSESKIIIKTFEELSCFTLNENNEWVPDLPSYFVGIEYCGEAPIGISELLTKFTGIEYNVFIS